MKYGSILIAVAFAAVLVANVFLLVPHHIEITTEGEGQVNPMEADAMLREDAHFVVTPADGWHVADIRTEGATATLDGNVLTVSVDTFRIGSAKVHVVFEKDAAPVHTITVTSSSGGSIEPSGEVWVEDGGSVTFRLTPDEGKVLRSLTVDGVVVATEVTEYTLSGVVSDHTVHAEFDDGGVVPVVLTGISITSMPYRTVYSAGDVFDPSGMVVTAYYSDGTSAVLGPDDYRIVPSGSLSKSDDHVTISYGGMTCEVRITVVDPSDFRVTVTGLSGTYMQNGALTQFSETLNVPLSGFSFRTSNIAPGVEQTAVMTVSNLTSVDLGAVVYISDLDLTGRALAEQMTLTVTCGSTSVTSAISEVSAGTFLEIGNIPAGGSVTVTVTLSFPNGEDNNQAMGQAIGFKLGVFADDIAGGSA